jgi:hypothetical protein
MEQKAFPKVEWGDLGVNWHDWLICQIIRREAEATIGEKASRIARARRNRPSAGCWSR